METTTQTPPRVLALSGTPHPKALVQSCDSATGSLAFAWLNASGDRVDSGGSVARFEPLQPLPKEKETDPYTFPEVDDQTLIAAIQEAAA